MHAVLYDNIEGSYTYGVQEMSSDFQGTQTITKRNVLALLSTINSSNDSNMYS